MGGVKIKDLKTHTNAVGGKWGDDTWAALVKDNLEGGFDTTDEGSDGLDETQPKRSLLIPINVFPSSQIMKIASILGQSEDYKKFGADEETPSGVEEIRNSTQRTGLSLNLVLSDVSSIMPPNDNAADVDEDNIVFEELQRPDDNDFLVDEEESDFEVDDENGTDIDEDEDPCEDDTDEESRVDNVEGDDMDFTCLELTGSELGKARRSMTMKAKKARDITVVEKNNKTLFVCHCGFSSTNKSGSTRHKCRNAHHSVLFPCSECGKICQNPGGLKRHIQTTHKPRQSISLPVGVDRLPIETPAQVEAPLNKCGVCGKVLANKKNLESHLLKMHGQAPSTTAVFDSQETTGLSFPLFIFILSRFQQGRLKVAIPRFP